MWRRTSPQWTTPVARFRSPTTAARRCSCGSIPGQHTRLHPRGLRVPRPIGEFRTKGAEIVGVSFDAQPRNASFAEAYGFPFPLLCDTDRRLGLAYGACDSPTAPSARRISYLIDPDGRILKAYSKVSAGEHPDEVLGDLP